MMTQENPSPPVTSFLDIMSSSSRAVNANLVMSISSPLNTSCPRRRCCSSICSFRRVLLLVILLTLGLQPAHGFAPSPRLQRRPLLKDSENSGGLSLVADHLTANATARNLTQDDWGASSWGAAILRLRKEEEEIMREIDQYEATEEEEEILEESLPLTDQVPLEFSLQVNVATAKELDASVSTVRDLKEGMTVLPMSPYYTNQLTHIVAIANDTLPLSRPQHYQDRINRDKRLLAIGITESVDHAWQWRQFQDERGGILPLIQTIQQGANFVKQQRLEVRNVVLQEYEETFLAACNACRALRDLCALSDEIRVVISDEVLRANAEYNGTLMKDLCSLLKHADEAEVLFSRLYQFRPKSNLFRLVGRKSRREARRRCKLYVLQMLLSMAVASDDAIDTFRATPELKDAILALSSYAFTQKTRRWLRYPGELYKSFRGRRRRRRPFVAAASVSDGVAGQVQATANQLLAAIGYNQWVPKIPGQKGLRILCFDGGGTRGMSAISSLRGLTEAMGGLEVCDTFDMIVGTSTGAIIAFLVGLRRETSQQANDRYDVLIERIFGKTTFRLSTLFTTATYSELPFAEILYDILGDSIMLDSRANPAVPLVFGVSSVMTSTPTYVTLFRNYNYAGGELPDHFVLDPDEARRTLGLKAEFKERAPKSEWRAKFDYTTFMTGEKLTKEGSRYYGSFRPLQREALRKSTAAPTIFKPVKVKDVLYCDGGIVASNPTAIAIHEARTLFPDIPIELVVSIGTGGFTEERFSPKFGWDAIIGQIVNSACDAERIHHVLEDMIDLGAGKQGMKYYRFNPVVGAPNEFPIDSKDPELLARLYDITTEYLEEPEQRRKLKEILDILVGKRGWRKFIPWLR